LEPCRVILNIFRCRIKLLTIESRKRNASDWIPAQNNLFICDSAKVSGISGAQGEAVGLREHWFPLRVNALSLRDLNHAAAVL